MINRRSLPLLFCVAAAVGILFRRLGATSLRNWDEATYAQVAKEIVQGGDWLTFHYGWQPWLEKPPLFIWSVAASFSLFGVNELSARLIAATAGLALVVVVFRIAELIYDRTTATLAVAILLTIPMFVESARSTMFDTPLTLFIYLAVYGYLRAGRGSERWWYLVGVSVGLAVLVKGAAAAVAPAAIASAALIDRRGRDFLRSKGLWGGVAVALLIAVPWHVLMYARHGETFLDVYLRHHTVGRVTQPIVMNSGGPWYYLEQFLKRCTPWVYLFPAALLVDLYALRRRRHSSILPVLVATVVILYSAAHTRIWWYVVPATPALAILSAALLTEVWRYGSRGRILRGATALGFLGCFAVGLQQIRLLQRPFTLPEAVLGRTAHSTGPGDRDLIIAYQGVQTPTLLYYSDRPAREMWSAAGLPGLLVEGCGRRIVLMAEDTSRLGRDYDLRILARHDDLAYGTIAARAPGQPGGPCGTR